MRYLPLSDDDRKEMLQKIGVKSDDELFSEIPKSALNLSFNRLGNHLSEFEVERILASYANENLNAKNAPFFIGGGLYNHHVPATVDHIIQRSEFLTSYTPYQPEITQGTLQTIFEFQTQVAELFGCDVANASMYDGSTALAEAVLMAARVSKKNKVILTQGVHPQYLETVKTSTQELGIEIIDEYSLFDNNQIANQSDLTFGIKSNLDETIAAVVIEYPNFFGSIEDLRSILADLKSKNILSIVVVKEVAALGLIEAPGKLGADIVVGEGQSFGNAMNYGGPSVGLFATSQKYVRQMPGRLCGETVDKNGKRGFVLTLSTREQHIRRAKATSNICTNSGLCALAFSIHLSLLGQKGLEQLAILNHNKALELKAELEKVKGVKVINSSFFNEFTIKVSSADNTTHSNGLANHVIEELVKRKILGGIPLSRLFYNSQNYDDLILVTATELTSSDDIKSLCKNLDEILNG